MFLLDFLRHSLPRGPDRLKDNKHTQRVRRHTRRSRGGGRVHVVSYRRRLPRGR